MVQDGRIGGGGVIFGAEYDATAGAVRSGNISWVDEEVSRESRIDHFGHRGAVIWLTGLSGSGKSTLATALEARLFQKGLCLDAAGWRQPAPRPVRRSRFLGGGSRGEYPARGGGRRS